MKTVTTIKAALGFDETGKRISKLRVCAYCRVSTMHEEQQNSFDAQIRHYSAMIENNPDWKFAGIYADEGISGKSKKNRTEFLRMIRDAENRKLDLVITKSISRFARNTTDCIETVRLLKGWGIGVFFEKENINTLSAESELILTIFKFHCRRRINIYVAEHSLVKSKAIQARQDAFSDRTFYGLLQRWQRWTGH